MSEINTLKIGISQIQDSVISGFDIQLCFVWFKVLKSFAPCYGIQESFGFCIVLDCIGFRIPNVSEIRIPKAVFRILKPKIPEFSEPGIRIPLHGAKD